MAKCVRCGKPAHLIYSFCEDCLNLSEEERKQPPGLEQTLAPSPTVGTESDGADAPRYTALAAVAAILRVVALLSMAASLIAAGVLVSHGESFISIAYLLAAALGCLGLWASAELIPVIIDIEANTRLHAQQNPNTYTGGTPGA